MTSISNSTTSTAFYRIENVSSGHVFGAFEAESADAALAMIAKQSREDVREWIENPEIKVSEISPRFTHGALAFIEETGADWRSDVRALLAGKGERTFRAEQLAGADEDRIDGIEDYVDALKDIVHVG